MIESIAWQSLYATQLLAAYERTLTIKVTPLSNTPYSWLTAEAAVAIIWLLKSRWNPGSSSLNPVGQEEASQDYPFATITMMYGSGSDRSSYQPSESSGQQTPEATTRPAGFCISSFYSGTGGGNGDPYKRLHSLAFNCFVNPCHGVCQFRPSSHGRLPAEWPPDSEQSSCPHLANGYCFRCMNYSDSVSAPHFMGAGAFNTTGAPGLANDGVNFPATAGGVSAINGLIVPRSLPEEAGISLALTQFIPPLETSEKQQTTTGSFQLSQSQPHVSGTNTVKAQSDQRFKFHTRQRTCEVTVIAKDGRQQSCGKVCGNAQALWAHKRRFHTGPQTCDVAVVNEAGQQQTCGIVCKNTQALMDHKCKFHSGRQQPICELTVVGKDGQQQACGKVCKNMKVMWVHKRRAHTGPQDCKVKVVTENGQVQPCGMVCKNAQALSLHKNRCHNGYRTCDVTVVGNDGQLRPCLMVFKNAQTLASHRKSAHSGQQICNAMVVGEDGLQRTCGKLFRNALHLSNHKSKFHTGQKTCDMTVVGEDGQSRPCGIICKNASTLSNHKSKEHSRQQICAATVIGEDGLWQPCGIVCMSVRALSQHKRKVHTRQQTCVTLVVGEDGQPWPCGKVCKSVKALTDHQRAHRKRKPDDMEQNRRLRPLKGKVNK
ncbi:hypothetical protein [Endozoicomonas sp. ONNA1]|nr:hypothetical protein [Endozoicomonas sp. ONNA1]